MRHLFEGEVTISGKGLRVALDVLGRSFTSKVADAEFTLTFPQPASDVADQGAFRSQLRPPPNRPLDRSAESWGSDCRFRDHSKDYGKVLELAIDGYIDLESAPLGDAGTVEIFGVLFNNWGKTASEWLELWTQQIVRFERRGAFGYGRLRFLKEDGGSGLERKWAEPVFDRRLWGQGQTTFKGAPAELAIVENAFKLASEGTRAPVEWVTLLNARRALDNRLAVIEAATAAEIAMSQAIESRLSRIQPEAVSRIIMSANGAAGLVKLLDALDGRAGVSRNRVLSLLAEPRNHAVHKGANPSSDVVDKAIKTSFDLLQEFSPLPGLE